MIENNGKIPDEYNESTIHHINDLESLPVSQIAEPERKEKIQKLCKEKYPDGPVLKESGTEEQDGKQPCDKNRGSHTLAELHHFQNNHK